MRFLYLWTSTDHASSSPRTQARTRRRSDQVRLDCSFWSLVAIVASTDPCSVLPKVELLGVPQGVGREHGGLHVPQAPVRAHEDVRTRQGDDGKLFGDDLLDA